MIAAALYPLVALLALVILWVLYLAVMGLARARDAGALSPIALRLGEILLAFGYLWDFLCNVLVVPLIFLDPPRQFTVSARLQQYVDGSAGWRKRLATWFAVNLLNPFSPSPHIRL